MHGKVEVSLGLCRSLLHSQSVPVTLCSLVRSVFDTVRWLTGTAAGLQRHWQRYSIMALLYDSGLTWGDLRKNRPAAVVVVVVVVVVGL